MSSKKSTIPYTKERVILSETLPFELPATFSNSSLYRFLVQHRIQHIDKKIEWEAGNPDISTILRLLFGIAQNKKIHTYQKQIGPKSVNFSYFNVKPEELVANPLKFKIKHKEKQFRELAICHPKNQLYLISFYEQYKELILYFCSISKFSIRKPSKVANYVYYQDKLHIDRFDRSKSSIEQFDKEYENLRSFFKYEKYSNIHSFYESYPFHRYEKKYNQLLKLDISKCFESIYTHSLSWAIHGKDSTKNLLLKEKSRLDNTYSAKFDLLMQRLNSLETNGIIIGPEFSRIFAELILQSIDNNVLLKLHSLPQPISHKIDYEIFRYVDDYFIFFNEDSTKNKIIDVLQVELREFKMHLSEEKQKLYTKPIITEITIAKNKIRSLLKEKLSYSKEVDEQGNFRISFNSRDVITHFKSSLKQANVEYKDILNWTLSLLERLLDKVLAKFISIEKNHTTIKEVSNVVINVLEFVFFIYSVTPRVNTTIWLCRVITKINILVKKPNIGLDNSLKFSSYSLIHENIIFLLKKFKQAEYTQIETLYLLIQLSELGPEYRLSQNDICSYCSINLDDKKSAKKSHLNYISLTVLFMYIKDHPIYIELRNYLEIVIKTKFIKSDPPTSIDTERTLLLLDFISCPYLSHETKIYLLNNNEVTSEEEIHSVLKLSEKDWFTHWRNFDFRKALDSKRSLEVY